MKKILSLLLILVLSIGLLSACSSANNGSGNSGAQTINVVSREDGSGTRGVFTEIVGVLEEIDGEEIDQTYEEAVIQNSTNGVLTTVAGDENSIGYISLGSLNDSVKALKINGTEATAENVQSGSFPIARPFNLAYQDELDELAQDFLNYILSEEGQSIVEEEGFIQIENPTTYEGSGGEGNIVVAGSTSVTPVMEKLAESYEGLYDGVSIEIQSTGSSAGMQSAMEGTADIGMASRELKDSELESLENVVMAIDGIAVIVNLDNPIEDLTVEQVQSIYTGEITSWDEVE